MVNTARAFVDKLRRVNWITTGFLLVVHLLGLVAAPWYMHAVRFSWATVALAGVMYLLTGLSITAGYHRLFSHGSYKAHPTVRLAFAIFGAGAVEGHIEEWVWNHRDHHRDTDDLEKDPYCFPKGFWHAHVGWMLVKAAPAPWRKEAQIGDLRNDWVVRWQKRNWLRLSVLVSFICPVLVAGLWWGDWMGAFLVAGWFRMVIIYHATWSVNSFAHWVGDQPFPTNISPRNSWWVALLTLGEGYHANHHRFDWDYRNAFRWYQFDPSKWLIAGLEKLGLAWDLCRVPQEDIRSAMRVE